MITGRDDRNGIVASPGPCHFSSPLSARGAAASHRTTPQPYPARTVRDKFAVAPNLNVPQNLP